MKNLCQGDKVEFEIIDGPKGPQAANLKIVERSGEWPMCGEPDADTIAVRAARARIERDRLRRMRSFTEKVARGRDSLAQEARELLGLGGGEESEKG